MSTFNPDRSHETIGIVESKPLICTSFDHDCFGLDGNHCRRERLFEQDGIIYHVLKADGICPMAR